MDVRNWFFFGHADPALITSVNGLADLYSTFRPWLIAEEGDYVFNRVVAAGDHRACSQLRVTVRQDCPSCGPCRSAKQEANLCRTRDRLRILINRACALGKQEARHG